jgi:hypothetical protein
MATNNSSNNQLGPNASLLMNSSGAMTLAQQPSFFCYQSTNLTNVTGNGTSFGLQFDSVIFDKASNLSSGIFVAPVSGVYQFNTSITLLQSTLSTSTAFTVIIQTDSGSYTPIAINPTSAASVLSNLTVSGSVVCKLDGGDFVEIVVTVSGLLAATVGIAGSTGPYVTYFSGALLN